MNDKNVVEKSMEHLLSKIDEAIDDMENERVISEEELWMEIEAI